MDVDPTTAAADPAPPPAAYCRRCGYALRGLQNGKCPECGGAFDLSDRKTFARRPPRSRLRRWAWRVSIMTALLALAVGGEQAWYYWQWRAEQRSLDTIRALGGTVKVRRVEAEGLARWLPERWAFLRDRASDVELLGLTVEQVGRLDLRRLHRLDRLVVWHCHAGDAVLAQLRGLSELKTLGLYATPLDGSGLADLADCRRLEALALHGTRLTDAGLAPVGRLTSLKILYLGGTGVTNAGLAHLTGLTSLKDLDLTGTVVTDAGILHLRELTSLRRVWLRDTGVTEQGRRDLQRALPNVVIDH